MSDSISYKQLSQFSKQHPDNYDLVLQRQFFEEQANIVQEKYILRYEKFIKNQTKLKQCSPPKRAGSDIRLQQWQLIDTNSQNEITIMDQKQVKNQIGIISGNQDIKPKTAQESQVELSSNEEFGIFRDRGEQAEFSSLDNETDKNNRVGSPYNHDPVVPFELEQSKDFVGTAGTESQKSQVLSTCSGKKEVQDPINEYFNENNIAKLNSIMADIQNAKTQSSFHRFETFGVGTSKQSSSQKKLGMCQKSSQGDQDSQIKHKFSSPDHFLTQKQSKKDIKSYKIKLNELNLDIKEPRKITKQQSFKSKPVQKLLRQVQSFRRKDLNVKNGLMSSGEQKQLHTLNLSTLSKNYNKNKLKLHNTIESGRGQHSNIRTAGSARREHGYIEPLQIQNKDLLDDLQAQPYENIDEAKKEPDVKKQRIKKQQTQRKLNKQFSLLNDLKDQATSKQQHQSQTNSPIVLQVSKIETRTRPQKVEDCHLRRNRKLKTAGCSPKLREIKQKLQSKENGTPIVDSAFPKAQFFNKRNPQVKDTESSRGKLSIQPFEYNFQLQTQMSQMSPVGSPKRKNSPIAQVEPPKNIKIQEKIHQNFCLDFRSLTKSSYTPEQRNWSSARIFEKQSIAESNVQLNCQSLPSSQFMTPIISSRRGVGTLKDPYAQTSVTPQVNQNDRDRIAYIRSKQIFNAEYHKGVNHLRFSHSVFRKCQNNSLQQRQLKIQDKRGQQCLSPRGKSNTQEIIISATPRNIFNTGQQQPNPFRAATQIIDDTNSNKPGSAFDSVGGALKSISLKKCLGPYKKPLVILQNTAQKLKLQTQSKQALKDLEFGVRRSQEISRQLVIESENSAFVTLKQSGMHDVSSSLKILDPVGINDSLDAETQLDISPHSSKGQTYQSQGIKKLRVFTNTGKVQIYQQQNRAMKQMHPQIPQMGANFLYKSYMT